MFVPAGKQKQSSAPNCTSGCTRGFNRIDSPPPAPFGCHKNVRCTCCGRAPEIKDCALIWMSRIHRSVIGHEDYHLLFLTSTMEKECYCVCCPLDALLNIQLLRRPRPGHGLLVTGCSLWLKRYSFATSRRARLPDSLVRRCAVVSVRISVGGESASPSMTNIPVRVK